MRHVAALIAVVLVALPFRSGAQTVRPGMSRSQVVAALGEPLTSRRANVMEYLFYRNSCVRRCGMHDLVILQRDSVVDAIFRDARRRYTGESSSPRAIPAAAARTRAAQARPGGRS